MHLYLRIISDDAGGYDELWILGDSFVQESSSFLHRYMGIGCNKPESPETSYIAQHLGVKLFANSANVSHMRSTLGRIRNIFTTALQPQNSDKLPKYILLVIENDLIRCVNFNKPGVSEIYGRILHWLASEIHEIIGTRRDALPQRAKKFGYPMVFWISLPYHQNFVNRVNRHKFNQAMDTVTALYPEMKSLHIRRIWSNVDTSVSRIGLITTDGIKKYWRGMDKALQFWENGQKCQAPAPQSTDVLCSPTSFISRMHREFERQNQGPNVKAHHNHQSKGHQDHVRWFPRGKTNGHKLPKYPRNF